MDTQQQTHALPRWFVAFQDSVGLSLLVIALMTINGIVYASGVVPDIQRPDTWGIFGTVLFVAFFAAGAALPGIALRAGAGIFAGPPLRRFACALIALMFFILEVWASVTERSLMTFTTPADRWLLSVLNLPNLPFSPTVFALSLAISIAVIAWGIVVTPPARESEEDAAHKERLKTLRAQAKADRLAIYARGIGGATHAAIAAATQDDTPTDTTGIDASNTPLLDASIQAHMEGQSPDESTGNDALDTPGIRRARRRNTPGISRLPSDMMTAPGFRSYLAQNGVNTPADKAVGIVQSTEGCIPVGRTYAAPRKALIKVAMRLIERERNRANTEPEAQEKGA